MDFSREWTDLGRIAELIEELRRISPEARLNYYKKLRRKEDLFFVSWAGHFFMDWFGADLDGKHNGNSWLLISRDVKTLQRIITEGRYCDRRDWERMYRELYRDRRYLFNTGLGYSFLKHLYLYLNPGKENAIDRQQSVPKHPLSFFKRISRVLMILLTIVCIGSLSIWAYLKVDEYRNRKELEQIHSSPEDETESKQTSADPDTNNDISEPAVKSDSVLENADLPTVLPEYEKALSENARLFGWIRSDGLAIDQPVVRPSEESDFYLHHDFSGNASDHGCLFVDATCSLDPRSNYIIVYGHNMRDNTMFGKIDYFEDPSYLASHNSISFDTIYEKSEYKALATLRTRLLNEDEEGFRYYRMNSYDSRSDWKELISFAKAALCAGSLEELEYGDELLLLSTCEYSQDNGRMVILCKRVDQSLAQP